MPTLNLRNLDDNTTTLFRLNTGARGLAYGEDLDDLIALHEVAKERAREESDTEYMEMLASLGLAEVLI